jgi:hypothetical protein
MPAILISIVASLLEGSSLGSILAALTLNQWLVIALGISSDLLVIVEQKLGDKHPAISQFLASIASGASAETSASLAHAYFANQPPTIQGYNSEGVVVDIPNPDYRSPA